MKNSIRKHYPFPEMADRGNTQWKINTSSHVGTCVDMKEGLLEVPLDGSEHSRFLRNHELGHIRWSPPCPQKQAAKHAIDKAVLNVVEDMRVQLKLEEAGLDVSAGAFPKTVAKAWANDVLKRGDPRMIILSAVAAVNSGEAEATLNEVYAEHPIGVHAIEVAKMAKEMMQRGTFGMPFKETVRVAKWLQLLLDGVSSKSPSGFGEGEGKPGGDDALSEFLKKMMGITKGHGLSGRGSNQVPWGKMEMDTPPCRKKVHGYLGYKNLAQEEGCNPRNIHRLLIDGRVFRTKRKSQGGSVLIDGSGSMDMSVDKLNAILEAAPGCTIGIYSAENREGKLRILAHKGRQVEEKYVKAPSGGCNVIDYPALQWLAKQSKPRFWVCDGRVTGVGDRSSSINALQCEVLTRNNHIKRFGVVEDTVNALKKFQK